MVPNKQKEWDTKLCIDSVFLSSVLQTRLELEKNLWTGIQQCFRNSMSSSANFKLNFVLYLKLDLAYSYWVDKSLFPLTQNLSLDWTIQQIAQVFGRH